MHTQNRPFSVWVSDEYRIGIKDNGCGIDEENLSRLTEAFYMVDKSQIGRAHV